MRYKLTIALFLKCVFAQCKYDLERYCLNQFHKTILLSTELITQNYTYNEYYEKKNKAKPKIGDKRKNQYMNQTTLNINIENL